MVTELKIGDYIEKSELDTEQKYNDVVDVFKQWGFNWGENAVSEFFSFVSYPANCVAICISPSGLYTAGTNATYIERKLTYDQVMSLKKTDVDNLNIDKVVSNEEVEAIQDAWQGVRSATNEAMNKSELLKLHAAADGLIRLGYVWDEEERAWCKIIKEYL